MNGGTWRALDSMVRIVTVAIMLLFGVLLACASEEQQGRSEEQIQAELAALEESHRALTAKREELSQLEAKVAAGASAISDEELSQGQSREELFASLEQRAQTVSGETLDQSDQFMAKLVDFINQDPVVQGEAPTERQLKALRMKTGEDVLVAREYIDEGGDYRRAIEILESARLADPDNEELERELEDMKSKRYMSTERFALATKGMTEAQVREVLGQVGLRNIREYPEKKVTAWLYPKEDGGAAGVYFRLDKEQLKVYETNYDAVKQQVDGGETEGGTE
jgi:hypothetical protein